MDRYRCAVAVAIGSLIATTILFAQNDESKGHPSVSPDKQWEYRIINEGQNVVGVLAKAGSDQPVLKLGDPGYGSLEIETGKLVWAPDSRRFAFNCRKGGKYYGSDIYELAGENWKKLPSLEENDRLEQMANQSLAKQAKRLRVDPKGLNEVMTIWRVRRWIDQDTFEGYASDQRRAMPRKDEDWEYFGWALIFTARCDDRGGWKVAADRLASEAESEESEDDL
ncbi:MAG: hypothetical protein JO308_17500 [Verrucomicrobia bacterium]|nr:hypothetical protein [Verrucomicrobiota bacterium]